MSRRRRHNGLTVLELMIVIAIIGMGVFLLRGGLRALTKADLVEDARDLATLLKRTSELSIETGVMHRVVFDIDKGLYEVEECQGATEIMRNEQVRADADKTKEQIEKGKQRFSDLPPEALSSPSADAGDDVKRAAAVAGHHIADRTCVPVKDGVTGIQNPRAKEGVEWGRALRADSDIKFKEIWVSHQTDGSTKGQVAIYFFPVGSSEKAVIEVTDGSDSFTVLVYGLTGRVELRDGKLKDVDDHMMRNAMGDKDAKREDSP